MSETIKTSQLEKVMPMDLINLDRRTRKLMLLELEYDLIRDQLYVSTRLTAKGKRDYQQLLRAAIISYGDQWFADQLRIENRIHQKLERKKSDGSVSRVKMPSNAADTLAEGEFNRYYIRALSIRALRDGYRELLIYRAKNVRKPRPESILKIGQRIRARAVLRDLRNHVGINAALGLPPGPNSGLSARLIRGAYAA